MPIEISPEDINRHVADAIIKSALGAEIEKQVKATIDRLDRGYDNPLQKLIEQQVFQIVALTIRENHRDAIKAAVHSRIADAITDDFVDKLIAKLWDSYFKAESR